MLYSSRPRTVFLQQHVLAARSPGRTDRNPRCHRLGNWPQCNAVRDRLAIYHGKRMYQIEATLPLNSGLNRHQAAFLHNPSVYQLQICLQPPRGPKPPGQIRSLVGPLDEVIGKPHKPSAGTCQTSGPNGARGKMRSPSGPDIRQRSRQDAFVSTFSQPGSDPRQGLTQDRV